MFTLKPLDHGIFFIVRTDSLVGDMYKSLPLEVHGFIKVEENDKGDVFCSYMNVSDELWVAGVGDKLEEEAKRKWFFQKNN